MRLIHPSELSLIDLARVTLRHRRLAGGFLLATAVATLLAAWLVPRNYRSESKLYIRMGRETTSLDPASVIGRDLPTTPFSPSRENEINSVCEILQSRVLLEQVVDQVGAEAILDGTAPQPTSETNARAESGQAAARHVVKTASLAIDSDTSRLPNDRDKAILALEKLLEIQAVKKSDVVRVTCKSHNPLLSQRIVATLVDLYLAEHLRLNRTSGAHDFLERETAQMREKLVAAEDELRALKDQTGLASPEAQRELIVERAARLEDELLINAAGLAGAEAEMRMLREQIAMVPKTTVTAGTAGIPNHGVDLMRNELYRLQMIEQDLSSKYTDQHFLVQQSRERTAAARKVLENEENSHDQVTSGPNVVYDQTQLALLKQDPILSSLQAKGRRLDDQLATVRQEMKDFNANELRIAQLTRDLKQHESNYEAYAQHLEQTRIDEALEIGRISSVNIIQPATFEPKSVGPRTSMILALGLTFGLLGAFGLPVVAEMFEPTVQNRADVEHHLGVRLLASIPRFRAEQLSGNGNGNGNGNGKNS